MLVKSTTVAAIFTGWSLCSMDGNHGVDWRTANGLCQLHYGTTLATLAKGTADRVSNRATNTSISGWIGLYQLSYQQWKWASGVPFNGYKNWIYNDVYPSPGRTCVTAQCTIGYEDTYGWGSPLDCTGTTTGFLCSTVSEHWSKRQWTDEEQAALEAEYAASIDASKNGLREPPAGLIPRYSLLRAFKYRIKPRKLKSWCNKRYGRNGASVRNAEELAELEQLLMDQNLLFTRTEGSDQLVWIGGKYDGVTNRWRWHDGTRIKWSVLKEAGVRIDQQRMKDSGKQCLVIDTLTNEWISMGCREQHGWNWMCHTPVLNRKSNIVRSSLKHSFCVAPWLYALLSIPIIVLNVFVHWWILRLVQYQSYLDCNDETELGKVFDRPQAVLASAVANYDSKGETVEMMKVASTSPRTKESTYNNDYFRRKVNQHITDVYNVPPGIGDIILDYAGKPSVHAFVQTQYNRWKWAIVPLRKVWILYHMPVRTMWLLLSLLATMIMYGHWAVRRTRYVCRAYLSLIRLHSNIAIVRNVCLFVCSLLFAHQQLMD